MSETTTSSGERPSLPMQGVPQPSLDEVLNLPRVHISSHPVMAHKMTALRDKNTQPPEFYRHVKEIGALLAYEATATLALETVPIETPMGPMISQRLAGGIGVTPILRAGLGLAEGLRVILLHLMRVLTTLAIFFQGWVMQEIDSLALFSRLNIE